MTSMTFGPAASTGGTGCVDVVGLCGGTARVIEVDGLRYAGSGSIVRQAAAYAAVTGHAVRVVNARARRPKPGLRPQHARAVEAMRELVGGSLDGVTVGSRTFTFHPGASAPQGNYAFDIRTAGSATALALAVLPVLTCRGRGVQVEVRGGVFQDFAPSMFHLQHVLLPAIARMGADATLDLLRPGFMPAGDGLIRLTVAPAPAALRPLVLDRPGPVRSMWGIALSSHLEERHVASRMARAACRLLVAHGHDAHIEERHDVTATHPGAALALFAELNNGVRLGADQVGAPHRRAERIGAGVARQLLSEIASGATLDTHATDQIVPFTALAAGKSVFQVASVTEHLRTGAWLASLFGAIVETSGTRVVIHGSGPGDRSAPAP